MPYDQPGTFTSRVLPPRPSPYDAALEQYGWVRPDVRWQVKGTPFLSRPTLSSDVSALPATGAYSPGTNTIYGTPTTPPVSIMHEVAHAADYGFAPRSGALGTRSWTPRFMLSMLTDPEMRDLSATYRGLGGYYNDDTMPLGTRLDILSRSLMPQEVLATAVNKYGQDLTTQAPQAVRQAMGNWVNFDWRPPVLNVPADKPPRYTPARAPVGMSVTAKPSVPTPWVRDYNAQDRSGMQLTIKPPVPTPARQPTPAYGGDFWQWMKQLTGR